MQSSKQEIINLGNGLFLLGKQTASSFFLAFLQGIWYTQDMGEKEKRHLTGRMRDKLQDHQIYHT